MKKARTKSGNVVSNIGKLLPNLETQFIRRWYVVASRTEAVIYEEHRLGPNTPSEWSVVKTLSNEEARLQEEQLVSDRPGRVFSSSVDGTIRHALDQRYIHHEKVASDFVRIIVEELASAKSAGSVDELVLVAEPHLLGIFREGLSDSMKGLVRQEVIRDFNNLTKNEIEDRIKEVAKENSP